MLTDKDKAAIAHIASVSREPHAEIRSEQLITGAKVEIRTPSGNWSEKHYPLWLSEAQYSLVYPKIKPAYRVYKLNDRQTTTVDRDSAGRILEHLDLEGVEWLGDWVEYDEPKKWPTPLVERIAAIKPEAAEWIVENWDDLLDDKYVTKDNYSRDSGMLISMFCWEASPQGTQYWNNIDNKLP